MRDYSVAVTGLGLITPLGCGVDLNWSRIRRGDSLANEPQSPDLPPELSAFARSSPFVNPNGHHRLFPMAFAAVQEALRSANLNRDQLKNLRVGCSVSVSKPVIAFTKKDESIDFLEQYFPDAVGRYILRELGVSGPCINIIAACATGVHSILAASRWLAENKCDIVLCGSIESSLHPLIVSGFKQMGVLSESPRPFDRDRNGFMMGEGAGVLILERRSDAIARGATLTAELAGCAVGTDVSHPTLFDKTGDSIVSVLNRALLDAQIEPRDLDYLNAHGTGTVLNDSIEVHAIKKVFGTEARNCSVSSTKGSTGHLLGASGSVEAAITCLAIRDQYAPPSACIRTPDSDLNFVLGQGQSKKIGHAASLSFGFGGPIGAVIFKR